MGDEAFFGIQAERLVRGARLAGTTPSGKFVDVFYPALEAPLHLVFSPSNTVQRIPAVVFGILAVLLTYVLGSRILDRTTALIAAMILGALPIAIIFSRIGWEYSEVPLLCLLVIYFAARAHESWANRVALLLSYLACIHVSPTTLFLAPVPLGVMMARWLEDTSEIPERRWRSPLVLTIAMLAAMTVVIGLIKRNHPCSKWFFATFPSPCDSSRFLTLYMRHLLGLCQGVPSETNPLLAWGFWGIFAVVLVFGSWSLICERAWVRLSLIAGTLASVAGYYVVVGPAGFLPETSRYGLFLLVPSIFAFACLIRSLLVEPAAEKIDVSRHFQLATFLVFGWLLMMSFKLNFFGEFEGQGGRGGESFWTLRTESTALMQEVALIVVKDMAGSRHCLNPTVIVAEDWWSGKPLQFHLVRRKDIQVANLMRLSPEQKRRIVVNQMRAGGYAIGPIGKAIDGVVKAEFPPKQLRCWQFGGYVIYRLQQGEPELASGTTKRERR